MIALALSDAPRCIVLQVYNEFFNTSAAVPTQRGVVNVRPTTCQETKRSRGDALQSATIVARMQSICRLQCMFAWFEAVHHPTETAVSGSKEEPLPCILTSSL